MMQLNSKAVAGTFFHKLFPSITYNSMFSCVSTNNGLYCKSSLGKYESCVNTLHLILLSNNMNCLGINYACMCACALVPARKRALEGQESEQTSAPTLLVQVSWARSAGFPLGRHFTASEEYKESHHHDNHLNTHMCTWPLGLTRGIHYACKKADTNTHTQSWCLPMQSFLFQWSFCPGGQTHS